jgi:hypothetical protein
MTSPRCRVRPAVRSGPLVIAAVTVGALLAACETGTAPVPGRPQVTFTLDDSVAQGDSVHGDVVATGDRDLVSLVVTVFDTAGADSAGAVVDGGTADDASKVEAKFAYVVVRTLPGHYVRFSAVALDAFGDTAIVRDSALVTP